MPAAGVRAKAMASKKDQKENEAVRRFHLNMIDSWPTPCVDTVLTKTSVVWCLESCVLFLGFFNCVIFL